MALLLVQDTRDFLLLSADSCTDCFTRLKHDKQHSYEILRIISLNQEEFKALYAYVPAMRCVCKNLCSVVVRSVQKA